jgi:hypothetical protein
MTDPDPTTPENRLGRGEQGLRGRPDACAA